jgi:hypothetical protein
VLAAGQTPQEKTDPVSDLTDYRKVDKAITVKMPKAAPGGVGMAGYLGVSVVQQGPIDVMVEEVQNASPGDKAGLKKGDKITRVGDHAVASPLAFREWLQVYIPGDEIKIGLVRGESSMEVTAKLIAPSRPKGKAAPDAGAGPGEGKDGKDNKDGKGGKGGKGGFGGGGKGQAPIALWQKPSFRFAVIRIEFPDYKHNSKVSTADWDEALFSREVYTNKKNVTGQTVYGSLNDYFIEQSAGGFNIEGKVFDWVDVGKKRADYAPGQGTVDKTAVLRDALAKLTKLKGEGTFKDFDGFFFIYSGSSPNTNQGNVYYPHVGRITNEEKSYPYLFAGEGGEKLASINSFVKLNAQILGLPDLVAKPQQGGFRGLGVWCALSTPLQSARPQHLGAWAKEKLGWIKPAVIDPAVKQKLILAPIEDSPRECVKILLRANGSEYYLLENRKRKGFDSDLPSEGLLIWRVVNDKPTLVESHGIEGLSGPTSHLASVPFPSEYNTAFTPDTTPSSRSPLGGGLPVHITEIRRLPDGRIAFCIGYEYR